MFSDTRLTFNLTTEYTSETEIITKFQIFGTKALLFIWQENIVSLPSCVDFFFFLFPLLLPPVIKYFYKPVNDQSQKLIMWDRIREKGPNACFFKF